MASPNDGKIRRTDADYKEYIEGQKRGHLPHGINPALGIAGLMAGMAGGMTGVPSNDLGTASAGGGETEFLLPDSPHSNTPLLQAGEVICQIKYLRLHVFQSVYSSSSIKMVSRVKQNFYQLSSKFKRGTEYSRSFRM